MSNSAPNAPKLVVGLGNPGADYSETRHNAGFWFCERLAVRERAQFRQESRFHGWLGKGLSGMWLLMPDTFMNRSGQSVGALARFYRIAPADILVVHDELDLPPGQARLKFGGGLGGHNGLKDITAHCGTHDYWRLRLGIGHPGERTGVVAYVLKPPRHEERVLIDETIDRALDAWADIARGAYDVARQKINTRPARNKEASS